jgi:hypothetical protein
VLALARPAWTVSAPPWVDIWVDDGPALFARDPDGSSRLDQAAHALSAALEERGAAGATLHALHRAGEVLSVTGTDAASLAGDLHAWLSAPGPGPLSLPLPTTTDERWLLSTGADPRTVDALAQRGFTRVVSVGRGGRNQALVHLSVRPSLQDPAQLRGLVEMWNPSPTPASRTLVLRLNGTPVEEAVLQVPAGERIGHAFAISTMHAHTLDAALGPAADDALPWDDTLSLDLTPAAAALAVALEGSCAPALRTFVSAHPGLRLAGTDGGLRIHCARTPPAGATPALWLLEGTAGEPRAEPALWSNPAPLDMPLLEAERIRPIEPPEPITGRALLSAGDSPLVIEQERPHRIALLLDIGELQHHPTLPALLARLLDRLAGRSLLMPDTLVQRDPFAAQVAPRPLPPARASGSAPARLEAAPWLLGAALALALYDLIRRARTVGAA